jgi:hypothetical protein
MGTRTLKRGGGLLMSLSSVHRGAIVVLTGLLLASIGANPVAAASPPCVPAGDLVTLEGFIPAGSGEFIFGRIQADGTSSGPFTIPGDTVLVVTGVDWLYVAGVPFATQALNVHVRNVADPTRRGSGLMSSLTLDPDGNGGTSESMTSGFAFGAGGELRAEQVIPMNGRIARVVLRGFLVSTL